MRSIALATLFFEKAKLFGSVLAVAAVVALVLLQTGLHTGFRRAASQVVNHAGGDVWVHMKGTRSFDDAQPIAPGHAFDTPCVKHVRRMVLDYAQHKRKDDRPVTVQVVGIDPMPVMPGREVPWALEKGSRAIADNAVVVDRLDAEELGVKATGDTLSLNGTEVRVGAFSHGVRPFTLTPYVFMQPEEANRVLHYETGTTTYFVLDATSEDCKKTLIASTFGDLRATATADFARATERRWVEDSGIGMLLRVGSLLSLFVGVLVLAQTLHALVTSHRKELATLKALGATTGQLLMFVGWQAGALSAAGGGLGLCTTFAVAKGLSASGVAVVFDAKTLATGLAGAILVTLLAALFAARPILRLDPTEVLG